jgi:hypothetical protein
VGVVRAAALANLATGVRVPRSLETIRGVNRHRDKLKVGVVAMLGIAQHLQCRNVRRPRWCLMSYCLSVHGRAR